jgi:hypothetical protein
MHLAYFLFGLFGKELLSNLVYEEELSSVLTGI